MYEVLVPIKFWKYCRDTLVIFERYSHEVTVEKYVRFFTANEDLLPNYAKVSVDYSSKISWKHKMTLDFIALHQAKFLSRKKLVYSRPSESSIILIE